MSKYLNMGNESGKFNYKKSGSQKKQTTSLDRREKVYEDILHFVGHTPLVKLQKIPKKENLSCDIYVKCEYLNPGGSVKDRIGIRMVDDFEKKGLVVPGKSVIIEPTSGNTGIGVALVSAVKGYRCIIVLSEKNSQEKVDALLALGAEVVRTPADVEHDDPNSIYNVADKIAKETPGGIVLNQYGNPSNPHAHRDTTAEEILWSLDHDVDMIVVGVGTGGTITGIAERVKEVCPKCQIVGVDPYGSIVAQPESLNKTDIKKYEVEGIGHADFIPDVVDRSLIDRWVKVYDQDSLVMARRLSKEEGVLAGASSGAAVFAAIQAAKNLGSGQRCVVILPDGIRNYLSKFVNDQWMEALNFSPIPRKKDIWWWEHETPLDVVHRVPCITSNKTVCDALHILRQNNADLLTVVNAKTGSFIGVFTPEFVRQRVTNNNGSLSEDLMKFVNKKVFKVDIKDRPPLGLVSRILDIEPFVVVVSSDKVEVYNPIGIIKSAHVLKYIADHGSACTFNHK